MDEEDLVRAVVGRAQRAGIFSDLDGTLAPIVATPELAQVLPEVPGVLARLVGHLGLVAVVSGRPSAEVRRLVGVDGVEAVGTHGLEDQPPMQPPVLRQIEEIASSVGAWVEIKGAAAAVHFRGLADAEAAETAAAPLLAGVAAANGLGLIGGKRILELMPAGRPRKGGAVEGIARSRDLEAAVFFGDDVGDLDAFAALGRLRAEGVWTGAVIARGPETSDEVAAAADLTVDGPEGVVRLLTAIADAVGVGPG